MNDDHLEGGSDDNVDVEEIKIGWSHRPSRLSDADVECSSENDDERIRGIQKTDAFLKKSNNLYKGTYFFLDENKINTKIEEESDSSELNSELSYVQDEGLPQNPILNSVAMLIQKLNLIT